MSDNRVQIDLVFTLRVIHLLLAVLAKDLELFARVSGKAVGAARSDASSN